MHCIFGVCVSLDMGENGGTSHMFMWESGMPRSGSAGYPVVVIYPEDSPWRCLVAKMLHPRRKTRRCRKFQSRYFEVSRPLFAAPLKLSDCQCANKRVSRQAQLSRWRGLFSNFQNVWLLSRSEEKFSTLNSFYEGTVKHLTLGIVPRRFVYLQ